MPVDITDVLGSFSFVEKQQCNQKSFYTSFFEFGWLLDKGLMTHSRIVPN